VEQFRSPYRTSSCRSGAEKLELGKPMHGPYLQKCQGSRELTFTFLTRRVHVFRKVHFALPAVVVLSSSLLEFIKYECGVITQAPCSALFSNIPSSLDISTEQSSVHSPRPHFTIATSASWLIQALSRALHLLFQQYCLLLMSLLRMMRSLKSSRSRTTSSRLRRLSGGECASDPELGLY
jgi:hypothetical protein